MNLRRWSVVKQQHTQWIQLADWIEYINGRQTLAQYDKAINWFIHRRVIRERQVQVILCFKWKCVVKQQYNTRQNDIKNNDSKWIRALPTLCRLFKYAVAVLRPSNKPFYNNIITDCKKSYDEDTDKMYWNDCGYCPVKCCLEIPITFN